MGIGKTRSADVDAGGEIIERIPFKSADDKGATGLAEDGVAAVGADKPARLRLGRAGMTELNYFKTLMTGRIAATLNAHDGIPCVPGSCDATSCTAGGGSCRKVGLTGQRDYSGGAIRGR